MCFHGINTTELSGDIVQPKDYQNPNKWNLFLFLFSILFQSRDVRKKKKKILNTELN